MSPPTWDAVGMDWLLAHWFEVSSLVGLALLCMGVRMLIRITAAQTMLLNAINERMKPAKEKRTDQEIRAFDDIIKQLDRHG